MNKIYKYQLKPTKSQITAIKQQLKIHKALYNHCLAKRELAYQDYEINISITNLIKFEVPKYKEQTNYSALQQTVRRLDKSYQAFFKGDSGKPRYKRRFRTIEFTFGDGCQIKNNKVYIQHVGQISCIWHRNLPSSPSRLSITFKNNKLFVCFIVKLEPDKQSKLRKSIGIDFGIQTTATLSNGDKFVSPKLTRPKLSNMARLERRKKYKALNKIYTKIQNQRKDFNHKLSRQIVNKYDIICLEDIKPSELITTVANINQRLYDVGIGQLIQMLTYKAESAGKLVIKVPPQYTTQTCSKCGDVKPKDINERIHNCECGYKNCRDINAAQNILALGLHSIG